MHSSISVYAHNILLSLMTIQWRSQSAADAGAQHGHSTFASSLVRRPLPAFSRLQYGKCRSNSSEPPPKKFGIFELFRSILWLLWAIPSPCIGTLDHAFAANLHARSVRSLYIVLTANTHTLRSGEHTRPRYPEDTDSYTAQLDFNTFSAQFAISDIRHQ